METSATASAEAGADPGGYRRVGEGKYINEVTEIKSLKCTQEDTVPEDKAAGSWGEALTNVK